MKQVAAKDRDTAANAGIHYRLQRGSYDDFSLDPDTGVVTLTRRLDHERRSQYSIEVLAVDSGQLGLFYKRGSGAGWQCPKIAFCLGVRVENWSPDKIARVEILEQNVSY